MNYLFIFLLVSFMSIINSMDNPDNQCSTCSTRPLSFQLHLNWPVSFYLSKYRNLLDTYVDRYFDGYVERFFITNNKQKYRSILNGFKTLQVKRYHEEFKIHNFMIVPFGCPFQYSRCFEPGKIVDIIDFELEHLIGNNNENNILNKMNRFWPTLDNRRFPNNSFFWNYQWNKHGSCTISQYNYFQYACDENILDIITNISQIAFGYSQINNLGIQNLQITPFKFLNDIKQIIQQRVIGIKCLQGLTRGLSRFNNEIVSIILCYKLDNSNNLNLVDCDTYFAKTNCENRTSSIFSSFRIDGSFYIKDILVP